MTTSVYASQDIPQPVMIHNTIEMESVIRAGFANVSIYRGNSIGLFRRNFSRTMNPRKRAVECFAYVSFAAPDAWGEAFGGASKEAIFDSFREYLVYEARDAQAGLTNILIGAAIRAIIDGGSAGYERAHDRITSLTSSCFNGGDDGTVQSAAILAGSEDEAARALKIGPNDIGDWWLPAINVHSR